MLDFQTVCVSVCVSVVSVSVVSVSVVSVSVSVVSVSLQSNSEVARCCLVQALITDRPNYLAAAC